MINFGPVPVGAVLPVFFASYAGSTGASVTLTGLAVTDIEIYKGTSMTQRASDAGYALLDTDGIDIDGTTGIHAFSIDTGDNTDSGFFAAGSFYTVVVSAVTVDSQAVNFIAATFRLVPAESSAGVPKVDVSHFGGTAGTFSSGRPEVNTTHAAGTAWASGAITAASIAADAITAAKIADGAIDAATFAAGAINAAAIASDAITDAKVASDVTIASVTGSVGSVTGNVGGNVTGSVGSIAAGGISAASFAAGAIDATAIATDAITSAELSASAIAEIQSGLSTLDAAGVRAAVGLASANLDTQIGTLATAANLATVKAKTDNLPASPAATGDIPTATQNADALLNRDMSAVSDTNSRSPLNALRHIRNKWSISGSTLTVTKEDDATAAWTSTLSTNASADPITGSDPA